MNTNYLKVYVHPPKWSLLIISIILLGGCSTSLWGPLPQDADGNIKYERIITADYVRGVDTHGASHYKMLPDDNIDLPTLDEIIGRAFAKGEKPGKSIQSPIPDPVFQKSSASPESAKAGSEQKPPVKRSVGDIPL